MKKSNGGSFAYYVVWKGRVPGVYQSWNACEEQVSHFPGAKFKGFKTKEAADKAFSNGPDYSPPSPPPLF